MSSASPSRHELFGLIGGFCNGTLTSIEARQLEQALREDTSVRQFYKSYLRLHADLYWRATSPRAAAVTLLVPLETATTCSTTVRSTTVIRHLAGDWAGLGGISRAIALGISGLLVVYFGLLIFSVVWDQAKWADRVDDRPHSFDGSHTTVAKVSDTLDVTWSDKAVLRAKNAAVKQGEPLKIDSGTMELELKAGTKLIVEGPADCSVEGNNRVSLRAGKLLALVPEQAVGFTVETPMAKIIDLGTEFGVEVSAPGTTEVQVLKGKVDVSYAVSSKPGESQQKVQMIAGQAKRFSAHGKDAKLTIVDVAPEMQSKFARKYLSPKNSRHSSTESSTAVGRLPVQGVMASSEFGLQKANRLIDGSGLQGDRHSNDPDDTMWHSALGRVKEEFVLFDLGPPRRLHSIKVWNYNENIGHVKLYQSRGVKHADIYVSLTGKWDPLTKPAEWTKVVSSVEFAMASGTDDYDTPDVIPLGNVEARFVAIVILDCMGPGPRGTPPSQECVGLSEVQFFGERIETTPKRRGPP